MMTRRELIRMLTGGVAGVPAAKSIERVEVKTADVIHVKFDHSCRPTAEQTVMISEKLKECFPDNKILLTIGMDIEVIRGGN